VPPCLRGRHFVINLNHTSSCKYAIHQGQLVRHVGNASSKPYIRRIPHTCSTTHQDMSLTRATNEYPLLHALTLILPLQKLARM
jgi:hypothetical protein